MTFLDISLQSQRKLHSRWRGYEGVYAEYVEPAIEVREDAYGQGYIGR